MCFGRVAHHCHLPSRVPALQWSQAAHVRQGGHRACTASAGAPSGIASTWRSRGALSGRAGRGMHGMRSCMKRSRPQTSWHATARPARSAGRAASGAAPSPFSLLQGCALCQGPCSPKLFSRILHNRLGWRRQHCIPFKGHHKSV